MFSKKETSKNQANNGKNGTKAERSMISSGIRIPKYSHDRRAMKARTLHNHGPRTLCVTVIDAIRPAKAHPGIFRPLGLDSALMVPSAGFQHAARNE
jgi:hypothetical protein